MKTAHYVSLVMFAALFAGCATVAPNELVDARSAYQVASQGPAKQLAPADLHKAHEALNLAEQSFLNEPHSYKTKDLAYVAQRKSEQAAALGSIGASRASKDNANYDFQQRQSDIMRQGKQDLNDAQRQAAAALAESEKQAAVKAAGAQAESDKQAAVKAADARAELEKQAALSAAQEKAAREKAAADLQRQRADMQSKQELKDSEQRTADALASLNALASVKRDARGLVLTLSGSVLFRSAESELMPNAQVKLDQVAQALLAIPGRNLVVEGHTDSRGSDAYNQELSQRRADAVRNYLVQKGYSADRIQAHGRGKGSPIANNGSAEGRANNRRVEIVIEREVISSK